MVRTTLHTGLIDNIYMKRWEEICTGRFVAWRVSSCLWSANRTPTYQKEEGAGEPPEAVTTLKREKRGSWWRGRADEVA